MQEELWKVVPGYEPYEASNLGNIRYKKESGNYNYLYKYITAKGYYRCILRESNRQKFLSVHKAVALAWVPNDNPSEANQVNHKDGDKLNNDYTNLEWVTGKDNVKHAFDIGLRTDRYGVKLINIDSEEITTYPSFKAAAEYLNIGSDTFVTYIKRSEKYPIFNTYVVELDTDVIDKMLNNVKSYPKQVYVYDHVNKTRSDYNSVALATIHTGINTYTIREALGAKAQLTYYCGGYTFTYDSFTTITYVSKEQASVDRTAVWSKPVARVHSGFELYNYVTGETSIYNDRSDVAYAVGCKLEAVTDATVRGANKKRTWLLNGYGIRILGNELPWHPYTQAEILCSKANLKFDTPVYYLSYSTGEHEYIFGSMELCKRYGLNLSTVKGYQAQGKDINKLILSDTVTVTRL